MNAKREMVPGTLRRGSSINQFFNIFTKCKSKYLATNLRLCLGTIILILIKTVKSSFVFHSLEQKVNKESYPFIPQSSVFLVSANIGGWWVKLSLRNYVGIRPLKQNCNHKWRQSHKIIVRNNRRHRIITSNAFCGNYGSNNFLFISKDDLVNVYSRFVDSDFRNYRTKRLLRPS